NQHGAIPNDFQHHNTINNDTLHQSNALLQNEINHFNRKNNENNANLICNDVVQHKYKIRLTSI
ncbi:hypothetical protein AAHH80_34220, partial [Burkholderia pseudomallei]